MNEEYTNKSDTALVYKLDKELSSDEIIQIGNRQKIDYPNAKRRIKNLSVGIGVVLLLLAFISSMSSSLNTNFYIKLLYAGLSVAAAYILLRPLFNSVDSE